jgi:hypothetical protein
MADIVESEPSAARYQILQSDRMRRTHEASIAYAPRNRRAGVGMPLLVIGLPTAALAGWDFPQEKEFGFALAADRRTARIVFAVGGVRLLRARHGGGSFHFGYLKEIGDDKRPKEFVPVRRLAPAQDGAVFEIDTPAWLRAAS